MTQSPAFFPRVESPCIKVCQLDAQSVCVGCGRTLAEIAAWSSMTDAARSAVRVEAAARLRGRARSASD
jgi:predicted Fe-S protein YdhL (DUF1289 family)